MRNDLIAMRIIDTGFRAKKAVIVLRPFVLLISLLLLFTWGCNSPVSPAFQEETVVEPRAIILPVSGPDEVILYLEVARTPAEQGKGLMERRSLAANRGMVFVFDRPVQNPFWMKNTYIPLSIAFVSADSVIVDIQDMEPLTLDLHHPAAEYLFAIEANKGFFAEKGVKVGDRVNLEGVNVT